MDDLALAHSILAGLSWGIVAVKAPFVILHRRHVVVSFYRFMVGLAVAFTLLVPSIATAVDRATGINNLSWLIAYLAISGGLFFLMDTVQGVSGTLLPVRLWFTGVFVNLALIVLFVATLRHDPPSLDRDLSQTSGQLLFILLAHGYGVAVFGILLQRWNEILAAEPFLAKKLRGSLFRLTLVLTIVWLSLKVVRVLWHTVVAAHPAVAAFPLLYPYLLAGIGMSLVFAMLPLACFEQIATWLVRLRDSVALVETTWLTRQLCHYHQEYYFQSTPWYSLWREPGLHLHRQIIFVYDCRRRLPSLSTLPVPLRNALQQLPGQADYSVTVWHVRRTSRSLLLRTIVAYFRLQ